MALPKIQHPLYDVVVPSTKAKLKFRPMLVKEEKILMMAKASGVGTEMLSAIEQVVNNCLETPLESMTLFDMEYIFLKIRAASVNNIVTIVVTDAEDKKNQEIKVDLNTVEVKFPETPPESKLSLGNDVVATLQYPETKMYHDDRLNQQGDVTSTIAEYSIDSVYYGEDKAVKFSDEKLEDRVAFIESLDIKSYDALRAWISSSPKLYHKLTYKNKAGEEKTVELNSLNDFFSY